MMKSMQPEGLILLSMVAWLMTVSCFSHERTETVMSQVKPLDLSPYSSAPPAKPVHLLFIHHSTGGQLLADKGPDAGKDCIYTTNPNGGGLRRLLEENNYIVHEASYGSQVGDKTDVCDWNRKFENQMDKVLTCRNQDESFTQGEKNGIVMFKSCFPNSWIDAEGTEPGDPDSPMKTTANYKAVYRAILGNFQQQPDTLFVVVTAPPNAMSTMGRVKLLVKSIIRKSDSYETLGNRVRGFNNWLKDTENGWLKDYRLNNVVVFDYYDVLTNYGESDWSLYGSNGGSDSHPDSVGNAKAAAEFVPFLNRAYSRKINIPAK